MAMGKSLLKRGFTIIELMIVVAVIAILAVLVFVGYRGITANATDKSVLSDLDTMDGLQTQYGLQHDTSGKAWYSGVSNITADSDLGFTPSKGNIVDVVINSSDYCIRIYNVTSTTYKNIDTAAEKESTDGICAVLAASSSAIADSPQGPMTWKAVAAGQTSSCAINSSDKAYCWGSNSNGKLGNNSTTNSSLPVAIDTTGVLSGKTIKKISVGTYNACVIASDNLPYCWGLGTTGGVGNNTFSNSLVPSAVYMSGVLSGKTVKEINVGSGFTCVIASDNLPYCWGFNATSGLGDGTTNNSAVPVAVTTSGALSGKTIVSMTAANSVCVYASDSNSYCWGDGYYGDGSTTSSSVPLLMGNSGSLSGLSITKVMLGPSHSCALASDSHVYCWGSNSLGRLGDGTTTTSYTPVAVSTSGVLSGLSISTIVIGGGSAQTCALSTFGQVYCWGSNAGGALGNGNTTNSNIPVAVSTSGVLSGKTVSQLAEGSSHACALANDQNIYCWGTGSSGQLGNGVASSSSTAVQVSSP